MSFPIRGSKTMNLTAAAQAFGGFALALALPGWGCLSMQSQTTIDGNNVTASTAPYVEAYVEYPGPQEKWSGPASFVLHVSAKDSGNAQITMVPALTVQRLEEPAKDGGAIPHEAPTLSTRVPASAIKPMSSEQAREQLARLSTALQGAGVPFHGCMSPVRVRLVRADGGLFEKQGCRSEGGWSRAVSESVNGFINASVHGTAGGAAPVVATHPAVSVPSGRQEKAASGGEHVAERLPASENHK